MIKCWILLKPWLGGVDGNLHFPLPSMNRLNETEPAILKMLQAPLQFCLSLFINGTGKCKLQPMPPPLHRLKQNSTLKHENGGIRWLSWNRQCGAVVLFHEKRRMVPNSKNACALNEKTIDTTHKHWNYITARYIDNAFLEIIWIFV
jgi:hypothetical protein